MTAHKNSNMNCTQEDQRNISNIPTSKSDVTLQSTRERITYKNQSVEQSVATLNS